jgi:RNA polymerase sigma-70 factor (ECF subfamily)
VDTVNGQPGIIFTKAGKVIQVLTFASEEGRVSRVYSVLNPDKLLRWAPGDPGGPIAGET